jgi:hypothetical protein
MVVTLWYRAPELLLGEKTYVSLACMYLYSSEFVAYLVFVPLA